MGQPGNAEQAGSPAASLWRIMVVDDQDPEIYAEYIPLMLPGCEGTPVSDTETALRILREDGPYHAVTVDLDVDYPRDGLLLIRQIRAGAAENGERGTPRDVPVLLLTGEEFRSYEWPHAGQTRNVSKPIGPRELLTMLKRIIEEHAAGVRHNLAPSPADDEAAAVLECMVNGLKQAGITPAQFRETPEWSLLVETVDEAGKVRDLQAVQFVHVSAKAALDEPRGVNDTTG